MLSPTAQLFKVQGAHTFVVTSAPVQRPQQQSGPPPNGGLWAWLQVVGGFCIFLNTWGVMNSFGNFQAYYATDLLAANSASQISWIGSLQAALLFIVSAAVGPLYDMGYMLTLLVAGSLLTVLGMFLTSICTQYWQFLLCQGLLIGLGNGCLFLLVITNIGQWFTTKKALATGIAATGGNFGGIIFPVLFDRIMNGSSFGWATRAIAFIMVAASAVSLCTMRQRVKSPSRRKLLRAEDFKDVPFQCLNMAALTGFAGVYVVFFYIQVFAESATPIKAESPQLAEYLVAILNAGGVLGRFLPNLFTDRVGYLNMQSFFAFLSAILAFVWIGVHTTAGVVSLTPIFAFTAGAFSTFGPTVTSLTSDLSVLGTRMGINLFLTGIGVLIGPPIAGAILSGTNNQWLGVQLWAGLLVAVSVGFLAVARIWKTGPSLVVKA